MKSLRSQQDSAGAVLVFALLILIVAAVTLGGVAQFAATRALVGAREWDEARQRVLLDNSRAMAREFVLQTMFLTNGPTNVSSAATAEGGFVVLTNTSANFWSSSSSGSGTNQTINPFTAMERGGFYPPVIQAGLWDGSTNADGSHRDDVFWNFQVRTRSPIAAGLSLACHNSDGHLAHTTASIPYFDHSNGVVGLTNMPSTAFTSATSGTNGYGGSLFETAAASFATYLTYTNVLITNQPSGTNWSAVVDLAPTLATIDPSNTNVVFRYVVPMTNGANPGFVTQVVLRGATNGASSPPVLVVVEANNTVMTNLLLTNNNTRRAYFTRLATNTSAPNLFVSSTNATSWRLGMTVVAGNKGLFTRSRVTFNTPSLTMTGGLRTDAEIAAAPTFTNETDPAGLDYLGDRIMWLEDRRAR